MSQVSTLHVRGRRSTRADARAGVRPVRQRWQAFICVPLAGRRRRVWVCLGSFQFEIEAGERRDFADDLKADGAFRGCRTPACIRRRVREALNEATR